MSICAYSFNWSRFSFYFRPAGCLRPPRAVSPSASPSPGLRRSGDFPQSDRSILPPVLLVIDNYDSFTYNLVQYFGQLGVEQRVFRNDEITPAEALALNPDRVLISPGPCSPVEAGVSLEMIAAFAGKKP